VGDLKLSTKKGIIQRLENWMKDLSLASKVSLLYT
jgi:hypothetical protein